MPDDNNRVLGTMDKLILEGLETESDFVEAARLVASLKLKNRSLEALAVDAISDLVGMRLIAVTKSTKIKITPLGKETLDKEGRLDPAKKRSLISG